MPKRKKNDSNKSLSSHERSKRSTTENYELDDSHEDHEELVLLPDPDDSGASDQSDCEDDEVRSFNNFLNTMSYEKVYNCYEENQDKLEKHHVYNWIDGEKACTDEIKETLHLKDSDKNKIANSTPVQLFEMFFCSTMKKYIIQATMENSYELSLQLLNAFIGIIIFSSFNKRKSQRDYWSTDPYLSSEVVKSTMSRNQFENVKSKIKYSKSSDNNQNDRGWRVRFLLEQFKKNIQQFGFFCSALAIDEMMVKSYARTVLKQFIKGKPIRFGLKIWGLATSSGYLLDLDLYCGKNSIVGGSVLAKCALGSRVVMHLLKQFLFVTSAKARSFYHIYFDNYFTSFDLIVHLKNLGLRATGTIRENRVREKNIIDKNAVRGTHAVKHDSNSGVNYITVKDSKQVSIASSAAGVTPTAPLKRYSSETREKVDLSFPSAFHIYNSFMGGVDVHDMHCNNLMPSIRSKKWTWVIFLRLIQAAITNAVVLHNTVRGDKKKVGTKEFALIIAKHYMEKAQSMRKPEKHDSCQKETQKRCCIEKCSTRTYKFCKQCVKYYCKTCFDEYHNNI